MPTDDPGNPDDPGFKMARTSLGGGGRGPIPGGGGGGGGLLGSSVSNLSILGGGMPQDSAALRMLLRKRLRGVLPGAPAGSPGAPSYTDTASGTKGMAAPAGLMDMLKSSGMFGYGGGAGSLTGTSGNMGVSPGGTGADWTPGGANPSGDPTIDLNPWSGTGWDRSRTLNQLYELLNQYAGSGAFTPGGNKGLMDATRSEALSNAEALRGRGDLVSRNLGVDPATAASYALRSDLNTQGGVADALNTASRGVLERQDAFGKDLLSMLANLNAQDWMAERQGDISKRYAPEQPGGIGGLLGQIGGRALGGWLSPGGWWGSGN